jgi:hypothetical protein
MIINIRLFPLLFRCRCSNSYIVNCAVVGCQKIGCCNGLYGQSLGIGFIDENHRSMFTIAWWLGLRKILIASNSIFSVFSLNGYY